jgi:hypothetical protein
MKLSTLWIIMIALQFTLLAFGNIAYDQTALFQFILSPFNWSATTLVVFLGATALTLVSTALVGSIIFGKTDTIIFAGVVGSFISFCVPIGSLWQVIAGEIGIFGNETIRGIAINNLIASVLVAPLAILSIATILNWWRTTGEG